MSAKYIRFNYFQVRLEPDVDPEVMQNQDHSAPWDMMELINYLSVRRNPLDPVVDLGEYRGELDRTTFINAVNPEVHSFQITKLRDTDLPSIKVIGIPREELNLAENQYIGEFISVVYDPLHCSVGVQSNIYSLNTSQIELFLTEIRRRHKHQTGNPDQVPLRVVLRPLIDFNKIGHIRNAGIFRKITIKGSAAAAEALSQNQTAHAISEMVGEIQGLNFEISFSLGHAPKDQSLNQEAIRNIIDTFNGIEEVNKPKMEISGRDDEEAPLEVINLLTPRLTNRIKINDENIQTIGHELMHSSFMEKYNDVRPAIARVTRINRR